MSDTELGRLLNHAMAHAGKSFFTMSQVREKSALRKAWDILPKATDAETAQKLRTLLPEGFLVRGGFKGKLYLCRDIPPEAVLLHKMATQKPPVSPGTLLLNLPMTKKEGIPAINALLASNRLVCTLNDAYEPRLTLAAEPVPEPSLEEDKKLFYQAYNALGGQKGRGFIRIYKIREMLAWERSRFDGLLLALLESDILEGQHGNPAELTTQQIEKCFVDPKGRLLVTVTWWGDLP